MIAVDAKNPVEIRAAGERVLHESLGPDIARLFMDQLSGRGRDYTKQKYEQPDMTDEEFEEHLALVKAEQGSGRWQGKK